MNQYTKNAPSDSERFWSKVEKQAINGCWEWQAYRTATGYGTFSINGKSMKAHRFAFAETHGPIADGVVICHSCDNPACVNPAHLFSGSIKTNSEDMTGKGRHGNQKKTHCPKGHEYTDSNTYRYTSARVCKECNKAASRAAKREKAAKRTEPSKAHCLKTHCKNGHEFNDENTYTRKVGNRVSRNCRKCNLLATKKLSLKPLKTPKP